VSHATVYCCNASVGEVKESLWLLFTGWGTAAACFSLSGCPIKDKGMDQLSLISCSWLFAQLKLRQHSSTKSSFHIHNGVS